MSKADGFTEKRAVLYRWLAEAALPLWADAGTDRVHGGFFEKLDDGFRPIEEPRRARLVARQIYVFATGHRFGWHGPATTLVEHGLTFLRDFLLRDDFTVVPSVGPDGRAVRADFDLYDTAFVLFGLAAAAEPPTERAGLARLAAQIRDRLVADWSHPVLGFEDARPARLPLKANPHMHLFEACLAWEAVAPGDGKWAGLADAIAELALTRLIDPESGAMREFFDHDWRPLAGEAGRLVEPGHQFEWSWLLQRWGLRRGERRAARPALRLLEIGETYGVDAVRGIAINALNDDFGVIDADARLWPQTERLKAWWLAGRSGLVDGSRARGRAEAALGGLLRYRDGKPSGLWWETMLKEGGFAPEPARASSLYHIVCAADAIEEARE